MLLRGIREHTLDMFVMIDTIRLELIFETLWCLSPTVAKDHWRTLRSKSEDPWKVAAPRVVEFTRKDRELAWLVRREFMEILRRVRLLESIKYKNF